MGLFIKQNNQLVQVGSSISTASGGGTQLYKHVCSITSPAIYIYNLANNCSLYNTENNISITVEIINNSSSSLDGEYLSYINYISMKLSFDFGGDQYWSGTPSEFGDMYTGNPRASLVSIDYKYNRYLLFDIDIYAQITGDTVTAL